MRIVAIRDPELESASLFLGRVSQEVRPGQAT